MLPTILLILFFTRFDLEKKEVKREPLFVFPLDLLKSGKMVGLNH